MANAEKNKVAYNPFADKKTDEAAAVQPSDSPYPSPKSFVEAGFLLPDRTGRLAAFMQKLRAGKPLNVLALGGSITEGSGSSDGEYYIDNLRRWFQSNFPKKPVTCINVGRGTTTSLFGAARIQRDLQPLSPDLVIVEYAVNDIILPKHLAAEAFEAVLRKLLNLPSRPAVFCLFCCCGNYASAEGFEAAIAAHYGLPAASYGQAIRDDLAKTLGEKALLLSAAETEKWVVDNYVFDGCHPNTKGYHLLTDFITDALLLAERKDKAKTGSTAESPLPAPLWSDRFVPARICDNRHLTVLSNTGWVRSDKSAPYPEYGFIAKTPGAKITFALPACRLITLVTRRSIKATAGVITVAVDDRPPFSLDAFFAGGWGTHNNYWVCLDDADPANHTLTLTFTGEKKPETLRFAKEQGLTVDEAGSQFILSEIEPA